MFKKVAIALLCTASLSGCASLISKSTGPTPVGLDSGTRGLGQVYIDASIERTAKINLYKLDQRFNQSRVNINSFHSSVLLTGQVADPHLKQLAEDNVKAMSDVKAVHNFITVSNQVSYNTIMQDAGVTANTRLLIMRAPVVSASKVLVHTEDGVLYVMGRLNTGEIADLNNVLKNVGNVTKIVTLIDNVEQQTPATPVSTTPSSASPIINSSPLNNSSAITPIANTAVTTPLAVEPSLVEPTNTLVRQ